MINLKVSPFNLDEDAIKWVNLTLSKMTVKEKIEQLFCIAGISTDENYLCNIANNKNFGGIMFRSGNAQNIQDAYRILQENTGIPFLLSANLESGGTGIANEGTHFGNPLQVAATKDPKYGYALGKISCSEGAAVGVNWSFAPIVDIDLNYRNPITNIRTFGSESELIVDLAKGYMDGAKEENVAVTLKHFPGDGVDDRDQHLLTSVNTLSAEEWTNSYGKIYRELINYGAQAVMVGHISLPGYVGKYTQDPSRKFLPSSLSKEVVTELLRKELGFNGLVVTDATQMIGYTTGMKRSDALPNSIAAGCDMLLFTKNMEEDINSVVKGYENGIITEERLSDAVARILATKAALKLHEKKQQLIPERSELSILQSAQHREWAKECADKSITLVKDIGHLLPLNKEKQPRLYLNVLESNDSINSALRQDLKKRFEDEGFEVNLRNRDFNVNIEAFLDGNPDERTIEVMNEIGSNVSDFAQKYDLAIYVANFETVSNQTAIRINWKGLSGMGDDAPWFTKEIPTVFISLSNPYHLQDVPMVQTYINAYSYNEFILQSLFDKLLGRSTFKGESPVDAFCGRQDTKY